LETRRDLAIPTINLDFVVSHAKSCHPGTLTVDFQSLSPQWACIDLWLIGGLFAPARLFPRDFAVLRAQMGRAQSPRYLAESVHL
jgi:hypothetical protein